MNCSLCNGGLNLLGDLGRVTWLRCRQCGYEQFRTALDPDLRSDAENALSLLARRREETGREHAAEPAIRQALHVTFAPEPLTEMFLSFEGGMDL
jgi:hypothetical protein